MAEKCSYFSSLKTMKMLILKKKCKKFENSVLNKSRNSYFYSKTFAKEYQIKSILVDIFTKVASFSAT